MRITFYNFFYLSSYLNSLELQVWNMNWLCNIHCNYYHLKACSKPRSFIRLWKFILYLQANECKLKNLSCSYVPCMWAVTTTLLVKTRTSLFTLHILREWIICNLQKIIAHVSDATGIKDITVAAEKLIVVLGEKIFSAYTW